MGRLQVLGMIETKIDGLTAYIDIIPETGQFTMLDVDTIKDIVKTLRKVKDSHVKTVRIYGHGGCFAVGGDIKTMHGYSGFDAKWFSRLGNTLFGLMRTMPKVVIAEIDGYCMGGGMDLAAAADFRFATSKSMFAHPGSKLGLITGFGGTQAMPRLMTASGASEFLTTGKVFDTKFMKKNNFLQGIAADRAEMKENVDDFCAKINRKSRTLLIDFKNNLDSSANISYP
jgi:enoyl-CoA hydratase